MIQAGMPKQIDDASGTTAPRISTTENDTANPRVDERPGAHHTWLFRYVKIAIDEAPISNRRFGLCQRQHLGVSSRVLEQFHLVMGASNDFAGSNDHDANGDLVSVTGLGSETQCLAHEQFIVRHLHQKVYTSSQLNLNEPVVKS